MVENIEIVQGSSRAPLDFRLAASGMHAYTDWRGQIDHVTHLPVYCHIGQINLLEVQSHAQPNTHAEFRDKHDPNV